MNALKIILFAVILILCAACSTKPVCPQATYPANLIQRGEPLQPYNGKNSDDLAGAYVQCTSDYYRLAVQHNGLVNAIGMNKY